MTTVSQLPPSTRPWATDRTRSRIADISSRLPVTDPDALAAVLKDSVDDTLEGFRGAINLYAGANRLSDLARSVASIEIGSRPTLGDPGEKFPSGVEPLDVLEVAAGDAVRASVGALFADVRPFSATMANLAVLCVFTEPGDTIAALPEAAGGHVSHRGGAPSVRGLHVADLPYDFEAFDLDYDALPGFLARTQPKLMIVGGNLMLKSLDLRRLVPIAREHGVAVLYDASHVAGLIAGGEFQNPLGDGVDVLTFSTYKSYGGPAGGAVCTNDPEIAQALSEAVYPVLTANYDVHRLAPLAVTASEHLRDGASYARACVANAQALGRVLAAAGIQVLAEGIGFTQSHQLAVDVRNHGGGKAVAARLEAVGIYCSPAVMPLGIDEAAENGLRFGTQELTTRGASSGTMTRIGQLVADVITGQISDDQARALVAELAAELD